VPAIAANIATGQASGLPIVLTYLGQNNPQQRVNRGVASANDRQEREFGHVAGGGKECDEYPFASTYEGGSRTVIAEVDGWEQRRQGGILNVFYRRAFGYAGGPQAKYTVLVVP
jgi:hypothetical protein